MSQEVFKLDEMTHFELKVKRVVVIDKDLFMKCKMLMSESSSEENLAEILHIPPSKVLFFKHKMNKFEGYMRTRRVERRLRNNKVEIKKPKRISSTERYRKARDMIVNNFSNAQICSILNISERSVSRFKRKIHNEKKELKRAGKLELVGDDSDDGNDFKYLKSQEKAELIRQLIKQRHVSSEIAQILNVSERSVRRWKSRLEMMPKSSEVDIHEVDQIMKNQDTKPKLNRIVLLSREKVEYARELIDNNCTNSELCTLLELSVATVRKLKMKIENNTVENMIENSEEYHKKHNKLIETLQDHDANFADPLSEILPVQKERAYKFRLGEREQAMVHLLRENNIRTKNIAHIMQISERSVTRLLSKTPKVDFHQYEADVVVEVEQLVAELTSQNQLIDNSKHQLAKNLLSMNVDIQDISNMLNVDEEVINKWIKKCEG